ncbi:MAG: MFS transporter [Bacteroidota bacterium]
MSTQQSNSFWKAASWVPSLYFVEGLPYIMVNVVSVIMYKNMEISNADIGIYTSLLYLPWLVKPFWSPVVDVMRTKRFWIVATQFALGIGFVGVALTLPLDNFFRYSLACMWALAIFSATHDIAADGFYMLGLREDLQSVYVGIRSFFYRMAMIAGQGAIVILAGYLEKEMPVAQAWQIVFLVLATFVVIAATYHWFLLPKVETVAQDSESASLNDLMRNLFDVFKTFFDKKDILLILGFLLLYRLGEAQLAKMASPFLLDDRNLGGLAFSTEQVGLIYGTIGMIGLILGGISGGVLASIHGLKYWLWWMLIAINLPNAVYIFLAITQPDSILLVSSCVAIEQFGYGFGFTAYMLYMIYVSDGPYKTAHFALCTAFMAAGMMIPGLFSGWLQESLGYQNFFIWVLVATIPAFVITYFLPLDPEFGKKRS